MRTYFEPTGIRVHDRSAPGEPRLLDLRLASVGRGTVRATVPPGRVVSEGSRVEIRRPGLTEWYINTHEGLEQGFTLTDRPSGEGALVLRLALSGSRVSVRDSELQIETHTGRRLRYGKLAVESADGTPVPARFEILGEQQIELVVDDQSARYPLTIDPLLTNTADTQLDSNQSNSLFGGSVASAGDVNMDGFDDVIVGAEEYDSGSFNEGAAFVFLGSSAGIANASSVTAATQLEGDQIAALFGTSVAGAGDINNDGYADVIVGALEYDAGQSNEGAAFIFLGSAAGIADAGAASAAAQLESNQAGAFFGTSVAGAGDVNNDGFDDVIIGAEEWSSPSSSEGAAFIFHGSAAGIADGDPSTAATQLESNQLGALMGTSVAGAGDVNMDGYADVIVGAQLYSAGQSDEGAAFVFLGSSTGIADGNPATAAAQLESNQAASLFGGSVAGAGDVNGDGYDDVLVGAEEYDAGQTNEGAAFIFLGGPAGIANGNPTTAATRLEANQSGAGLGASVAGAGDVNADGYGDVIVGAPQYDAPTFNEGAAFVFLGGVGGIPNGHPGTAFAQLESNQLAAQLAGVAGAGDVNGDGSDDVIVGADQYDGGATDSGAAFVYLPEPSRNTLLLAGLVLIATGCRWRAGSTAGSHLPRVSAGPR